MEGETGPPLTSTSVCSTRGNGSGAAAAAAHGCSVKRGRVRPRRFPPLVRNERANGATRTGRHDRGMPRSTSGQDVAPFARDAFRPGRILPGRIRPGRSIGTAAPTRFIINDSERRRSLAATSSPESLHRFFHFSAVFFFAHPRHRWVFLFNGRSFNHLSFAAATATGQRKRRETQSSHPQPSKLFHRLNLSE